MSLPEIRTLVCRRDLANALLCWESLEAALLQPFQLVIHEDGSLSESDVDRVQAKFPRAQVRRRCVEEETVLEKLRHYPKCREYRNRHPISNKLLDIPLSSGGTLQFIDCDILFFRRVRELFPETPGPVFMFEDDEGHSGPLLNLCWKRRLPIAAGFNAGLFSLDLDQYYDLDRIEWLLGRDDLMVQIGMADQTCYACLAGVNGLRYFSPRQFFCSKFVPIVVSEQTIAVHFIYHLKGKIPGYHQTSLPRIAGSRPAETAFIPARPLTIWKIFRRRLGRPYRRMAP